MLVLPAKPSNPGLPGSFEDGDKDRLPADLAVRLLTLFASQLDERLISHRLHKPVAQKTQGQPGRAHIFTIRHALLDFGGGKRPIGTRDALRPSTLHLMFMSTRVEGEVNYCRKKAVRTRPALRPSIITTRKY